MKYFKKSLGQNFLTDQNILNKIINLTDIKNRHVLEIGSGDGALSDQLIKQKPKSLILIEKDNALSEKLKIKYYKNKNIKIYNNDILNFDIEKILEKNTIIFGNLPYNISSQILAKLIKFKNWPPKYSNLILMFQKEMAERITGIFGTKKYGRISILCQYRLKLLKQFDISPNSFFPKPKIFSTLILFEPKKKPFNQLKNIENLEKITNIFFSNRRKMINKNIKKVLKNLSTKELAKKFKLNLRPSDLKPEQYYQITELFEKI
jgi:16S rRNA (adenine1518-N6/adenine1519-N6)-dimethyltransferase